MLVNLINDIILSLLYHVMNINLISTKKIWYYKKIIEKIKSNTDVDGN